MRVFPLNERFSGPEWNETKLRRYKQLQHQLQIINGVLVRNYKIEPFSETWTVLIYPDTMKISVLSQVHDEAGHQGIEKTLSRLKPVAFLVNMASDVVNYVTSCEASQRGKLALPVKAPLQNTPIGRTMQLFQVDILEIPMSDKGNKYFI